MFFKPFDTAAETVPSMTDEDSEGDSGHPSGRREDCQVCGGQESERWHFDSVLRGRVCDDCHRGVVRD